MMIKIINRNLNSIKAKLPELQQILAENNPQHILCIQEIQLKPSDQTKLKHFPVFRRDVENSGSFERRCFNCC